MRRKLLQKFNLKYAIGEVFLIFVGITFAIWFNNWNELRKLRITEIKSLTEIKTAISQDLLDIQENISGFSTRVDIYQQLVKHIEEDLALSDSLASDIPYIMGKTTFLANIGPYETLKSRGLEIISNDSLRVKISTLYDYDYEQIQTSEKEHHEHRNKYLKPLFLKKFDFANNLAPIESVSVLDDFEFRQSMYWALMIDSGMLRLYTNLEKKCETLITEIADEIKSLR